MCRKIHCSCCNNCIERRLISLSGGAAGNKSGQMKTVIKGAASWKMYPCVLYVCGVDKKGENLLHGPEKQVTVKSQHQQF